jgi:hypothetical protein
MAELTVSKADPIGEYPAPDAHIHITDKLPKWQATLADLDAYFDGQAGLVDAVLVQSLPGGVYDRLLGRMLARKASHFRVAYQDAEVTP